MSRQAAVRVWGWIFLACFAIGHSALLGADEPPFQLQPGEFPPPDKAREISGELIALDHLNRSGMLRVDRTDAQRRGDWDLPLPFVLLPYGSLSYHGAPAELRDIPIGTHLHGQFFTDAALAKELRSKLTTVDSRVCAEADFCRAFRLEDDFSWAARMPRAWRIDAIDLEKNTLTAIGVTAGKDDPKPTIFQLAPSTRIWRERGFGALTDLVVGQSVLINLTVVTLKGPGRCTDIWLDAESRGLAAAQQTEVHRQFIREHGLPGMIDEVDNAAGIVSVTLFAGFDPKLMEDFPNGEMMAAAAKGPPFVPGPGLVDPVAVTAAVTEENLRTWDQINDRKAGPLVEVQSVPAGPGNSGVRIKFKPAVLLEGFRPKRIVRLWCSKWKVDDLPREERMYH
jgi:hypothetical protein